MQEPVDPNLGRKSMVIGVLDDKDDMDAPTAKPRMDVEGDSTTHSGTTTDDDNHQQTDAINDEELADSAFGKSIQKKVHIAEFVKEPTATVRKPKGNKTLLREDARRETLVNIKRNVSGVLFSKVGPSTSSSI